MAHAEFERFPFAIASGTIDAASIIARESGFIPTRRIQQIIDEVVEEAPPPPPTYSEEELQAAKEDAYRDGFNDGEKKGLAFAQSEIANIEQAALEQIPQIIEQMQSAFATYEQFASQQKQVLPQLALALAKKICGHLPPEHLLEQVVRHTTECIEVMLGEPQLHVFVHPSLCDKVEERLASHFANHHEPGDVIIHADGALAMSDCRVEWKSGGMEYSHDAVLAQLDELVAGISSQDVTVKSVSAEDIALVTEDIEPELNDVVSEAIAQQLSVDDIPPIPEDPAPREPMQAAEQSHMIVPDKGKNSDDNHTATDDNNKD